MARTGEQKSGSAKKTRATHFTYKASCMVQNQNAEGIKSSRKGSQLKKDMQKALEEYCQKKSEE